MVLLSFFFIYLLDLSSISCPCKSVNIFEDERDSKLLLSLRLEIIWFNFEKIPSFCRTPITLSWSISKLATVGFQCARVPVRVCALKLSFFTFYLKIFSFFSQFSSWLFPFISVRITTTLSGFRITATVGVVDAVFVQVDGASSRDDGWRQFSVKTKTVRFVETRWNFLLMWHWERQAFKIERSR